MYSFGGLLCHIRVPLILHLLFAAVVRRIRTAGISSRTGPLVNTNRNLSQHRSSGLLNKAICQSRNLGSGESSAVVVEKAR